MSARCLVTGHAWRVESQERTCQRCHKFQRFTIVDMGRRKLWLTFKRTEGDGE